MREVAAKEKSGLKGEGFLYGCDNCNFLFLQKHGHKGALTLNLVRVKLSEYEAKDEDEEKERHEFRLPVRQCPKCGGKAEIINNSVLRLIFKGATFPFCENCDLILVQSSRELLSVRAVPVSAKVLIGLEEKINDSINEVLEEERKRSEEENRRRAERKCEEDEWRDPDFTINRGAVVYTATNSCATCDRKFKNGEEVLIVERENLAYCYKKCGRKAGAHEVRKFRDY